PPGRVFAFARPELPESRPDISEPQACIRQTCTPQTRTEPLLHEPTMYLKTAITQPVAPFALPSPDAEPSATVARQRLASTSGGLERYAATRPSLRPGCRNQRAR